jgi:hypothetical protein
MRTVTSFTDDARRSDELSAILADYLTLEHLRCFRRLLIKRFAILTALVLLAGVLWLSRIAATVAAGLCLTPPIWAWAIEIQCERRLARKLDTLPGIGSA